LTLDNDAIVALINSYDKDTRAIKEEALKMSWYMRGGLSYDDAMTLSSQEREIVSSIIKKNIETTKESGLPFF
jgi:DNA polymerase III delta subunit